MNKKLFLTLLILGLLVVLGQQTQADKTKTDISSDDEDEFEAGEFSGFELEIEKVEDEFDEEPENDDLEENGIGEASSKAQSKVKNCVGKHHKKKKKELDNCSKYEGDKKQKCCRKMLKFCKDYCCDHEDLKNCKPVSMSTPKKSTETTTKKTNLTTSASTNITKYPDSLKQVIKKCKKLFIKYLDLTIDCGRDPEQTARSRNSSEHVVINYIPEDHHMNLFADALLKTLQRQINLHGIDYSKLEFSIKTLENSGMLSIKSNSYDLSLPFTLNKKNRPK